MRAAVVMTDAKASGQLLADLRTLLTVSNRFADDPILNHLQRDQLKEAIARVRAAIGGAA